MYCSFASESESDKDNSSTSLVFDMFSELKVERAD